MAEGGSMRERWMKVLASGLILIALFLVLARLSFDPNDIAYFSHPPQNPALNWGGGIGAQTCYALLSTFGEAFWWLPVVFLIWSLALMNQVVLDLWRSAVGLLVALPSTALVLDLALVGHPVWAASYGGIFGWRYGDMMMEVVGPAGIAITLAVCFGLLAWLLQVQTWVRLLPLAVPKVSMPSLPGRSPKAPKADPAPEPEEEPRRPTLEERAMADVRPLGSVVQEEVEEEEEEAPPIVPLPDEPEEVEEVIQPQAPAQPQVMPPKAKDGEYVLPGEDLLSPPIVSITDSDDFMNQRARQLESMFEKFKVGCKVIGMVRGPAISQFEMVIDEGTRVNKVTGLSDNIALTLKAPNVRIVAPIPGRNSIGIEIPNLKKEMVNLRSILENPECKARMENMKLPLLLGKDVVGAPLVEDLAKMPHALVAGTTGSGKSVCINSIIISLIFYHRPDTVRLLMIDPKMVEMSGYEGIPHLMRPVITKMEEAAGVLDWACRTMDERYAMLTRVKVRDISSYNKLSKSKVKEMVGGEENMEKMEWPMPYIVIIVDEFADLMMSGAKEVESYITRLAQKSRAVGIHVILATQRPSVDVITGLIKTNMPTRVAFQVAAKIDSRTILDQNGAEGLMGKGDMLFLPPGVSALTRAQGVMIDDDEITNVVEFWKAQGEPNYIESEAIQSPSEGSSGGGGESAEDEGQSEDFAKAVQLAVETGRPSASYIQRQLRVGYNKASRFVELMETMGVVGPPKGSKGREILWTMEDVSKWMKKGG